YYQASPTIPKRDILGRGGNHLRELEREVVEKIEILAALSRREVVKDVRPLISLGKSLIMPSVREQPARARSLSWERYLRTNHRPSVLRVMTLHSNFRVLDMGRLAVVIGRAPQVPLCLPRIRLLP
ncbi:hypothetical protein Dimus_021982, partial [Dionaea muscipula]